MENSKRNDVCVSFHCLNTGFAEIVPNFDCLVVACSNEIRFICSGVEIYIVDTFFMSFQRKVGGGRAKGPHFNGTIKTRGSKSVGILWVERQIHDVMCVSFIDLR